MARKYIISTDDVAHFDKVTRHGVSDIGKNGITGDDTHLSPDYGTEANKVTEGNDARLPTTDEKAAMANANSPSASNPFLTEDDSVSFGYWEPDENGDLMLSNSYQIDAYWDLNGEDLMSAVDRSLNNYFELDSNRDITTKAA